MGSGGGGDGGMMMMMMIIMMQQMEAQKAEMQRQQEQQAFQAAQRAESQNYQRYQDLLTAQNKKVGDAWDLYNQNIDKILKINPGYTANKKYVFNPYTVNSQYSRSRNRNEADSNTDLLNKWYADIDKQALDDYNMAKSQYEASKIWLAEAQAAQDAAGRVLPGAPPGTWGAGGEQVSGGAGADAEKNPADAVGGAIGGAGGSLADVYNNFASVGSAGLSSSGGRAGSNIGMGGGLAGTGFLGDDGAGNDNLAGMFGQAVGMGPPNPRQAGYSIF